MPWRVKTPTAVSLVTASATGLGSAQSRLPRRRAPRRVQGHRGCQGPAARPGACSLPPECGAQHWGCPTPAGRVARVVGGDERFQYLPQPAVAWVVLVRRCTECGNSHPWVLGYRLDDGDVEDRGELFGEVPLAGSARYAIMGTSPSAAPVRHRDRRQHHPHARSNTARRRFSASLTAAWVRCIVMAVALTLLVRSSSREHGNGERFRCGPDAPWYAVERGWRSSLGLDVVQPRGESA